MVNGVVKKPPDFATFACERRGKTLTWKSRLGKEKEDKPFLQGWAVVENATDEDWKDVRMALVSGRPISFQMDLYTPLYVPRPVVVPELFASLRPVAYNGDLDSRLKTALGQQVRMTAQIDR